MKAIPLENFSSLSEMAWFNLQYSFNLHTPLTIHPLAYMTFEMRDAALKPSCEKCCYSIAVTRWRLDISEYKTIECFLKGCNSRQRNKYRKSKRVFFGYGCRTEYQENDWYSLIPQVYKLYCNTAKRYGTALYDLSFFEKCAKKSDCSLLTAWYKEEMIGMTILQKEGTTLHSICGGFDYVHSSPSYVYSCLNYALIETAILSGKYNEVDVGMTADVAKSNIGYHPIPSRLDVYTKSPLTRTLLTTIAPYIKTRLDTNGKLKLSH